MSYVAGSTVPSGTCVLCDIARSDSDEANLVVARSATAFVVLNLYPYNSGHLLIVPYTHVGRLEDLDPEIGADMWRLTERAVRALGAEYQAEGYNVGMNLGKVAGAGIPDHLHTHIVPRWNGDTNFMPILAETKVLPESLQETWRRLRRVMSDPSVQ
jgi:ATP adenylyltransferase